MAKTPAEGHFTLKLHGGGTLLRRSDHPPMGPLSQLMGCGKCSMWPKVIVPLQVDRATARRYLFGRSASPSPSGLGDKRRGQAPAIPAESARHYPRPSRTGG